MHVGVGGFGVGGRPDINGKVDSKNNVHADYSSFDDFIYINYGTDIGFSFDWSVIVSDSVFFFMWGLNLTVFGFMVGSAGDRQEVRRGHRHRERGRVWHRVPLGTPCECVGQRAMLRVRGRRRYGGTSTPVRVGHRANAAESDCESDASGTSEPEGLTDSSSESNTVATGGRVRRIVKGIEVSTRSESSPTSTLFADSSGQ